MPFGRKQDIDFNSVFSQYIEPALKSEGFEVFRADQERRAGEIRTDMFQELLASDLVVVDVSIDNPNVWYELGVRHSLRSRGVVLVYAEGVRQNAPFDVYTDRRVVYHLQNGAPDAATLEQDRRSLAEFVRATMSSWWQRPHSPVYQLLELREPEWKNLMLRDDESHARFRDWCDRVDAARRKGRAGDIVVLAHEAPTLLLRADARAKAAQELIRLGSYRFALEQVDAALESDPGHLESRRLKAVLLGRLGRRQDAEQMLERLANDYPGDPEILALVGRVRKESWMGEWNQPGLARKHLQERAKSCSYLLADTIAPYLQGFRHSPGHYYSGINALTMMHLQKHLDGTTTSELAVLENAVRWAARSSADRDENDYWARATLAEIELLVGTQEALIQAYRQAMQVAHRLNGLFMIDASFQQVQLLEALGFRPAETAAARTLLEAARGRVLMSKPPREVFLFSGHMIDAPNRPQPRFPPQKVPAARQAIAAILQEFQAGPEDLALCGGACGGDLLFAEECLRRGTRLELRIPFEEPRFLETSVLFAGEEWRASFRSATANPHTSLFVLPEELGPTPPEADPYERNNLWQLYSALAQGPERLRFICLWDGKPAAGRGGTEHMMAETNAHASVVRRIDPAALA
jgi:tetratricopeptide (TPR) repeat protein